MKLVIIESLHAGDVDRNMAYARRAMADSLKRGEAPLASHLLYTQPGVLDGLPSRRLQRIAPGPDLARAGPGVGESMGAGMSLRGRLRVDPQEFQRFEREPVG